MIRVQMEEFDIGMEINQLRKRSGNVGAIVSFVGQVRDLNDGDIVSELTLEHYQGMTEKSLQSIEEEAKKRWRIQDSLIIHRYGTLQPLDQIVLVVTASAHRGDAFSACEFIMDFLKTQAPFWKKEATLDGARWLDAKSTDDDAKNRWNK